MKVLKVVVAVIITFVMLYIARTNSRGQPEYYSHSENGYSFEYTSVPKGLENTSVTIPLTITGPLSDSVRPVFVRLAADNPAVGEASQVEAIPMQPCDSAANCYSTVVRAGEKSGRFYYYFEIQDAGGTALATFAQPDGRPFLFRYIGAVPSVILLSHIVAIFATVFFVALGATHAFSLVHGSGNARPLAMYSMLAALFAFLGGYPFGFMMNWYAFGVVWEGVPFGTDATD
ncbi:MAG: hypothetical protein JSW34_05740, partial [Candidatus Zixiibacteriota bacterium]